MVRAVDVAAYTLNQLEFATTMKLQKLVYKARGQILLLSGCRRLNDKKEITDRTSQTRKKLNAFSNPSSADMSPLFTA